MSIVMMLGAIVVGLLLGSFFNVLISRLPQNESILFPASRCPICKSPIRPWHNIPVISFILLGGKCRSCRNPISLIYPAIELLTAAAAAAVWVHVSRPLTGGDFTPVTLLQPGCAALFLLLLIPVSVIDLKHLIIPDSISLPFIAIGLLTSFLPGQPTPLDSFLGILAGGGSLYLIGVIGEFFLKKEAMGGGDVKLMAAAGALFGPVTALLAIMFGAFTGALYGITVMFAKKLSSTHQIPFGPFLAAGIWIALFFGHDLLNAYFAMLGMSPPALKAF